MNHYEKTIAYWNEVFNKEKNLNVDKSTGNIDIDKALDWLVIDSNSVLDFGCGNGNLLMKCGLRGTKLHFGIDISKEGINQAQKRSALVKGIYEFQEGSIEELKQIPSNSLDAAILSNIVDNVIIEDSNEILKEIHRIVKTGGKIFFKVNPYLSEQQIKEYEITDLNRGLLYEQTGLYLYNLKTNEWEEILKRYFNIYQYQEIFYPEYEQTNRLFLLINN